MSSSAVGLGSLDMGVTDGDLVLGPVGLSTAASFSRIASTSMDRGRGGMSMGKTLFLGGVLGNASARIASIFLADLHQELQK